MEVKKYLIISLFLLLGGLFVTGGQVIVEDGKLNVTEDFFVDTNVLYVDSTNDRVGIGVQNPTHLLHVNDDSYFGTSILINATNCDTLDTDANGLIICGTDSDTSYDDTSVNASIADLDVQVYNNATQRIADNTTLTNMIAGIGNVQGGWTNTTGVIYTTQIGDSVGIGTTAPSKTLEVAGDAAVHTLNATSIYSSGNVTLSEDISLSDDKIMYMGDEQVYSNGTCMIITGSTSRLEIC